MNQENTSKLLKRFPVLYQDYYSPMQQTCMCWGFSCSDGWFEIIWQLSLAIEDHLGYTPFKKRKFMFKRTYARVWNDLIYKLSPVVCDKRERLGTGTKDDPLRWEIVGKAPDCDWTMTLAQALLPDRSSDFGSTIGSFQRSGLKQFVVHPDTGFRVDQVKEKFGTLRFYCSTDDTIRRYVGFAESLSAVTCEQCGAYGKTESVGGWMSTRCKKHSDIEEKCDAVA